MRLPVHRFHTRVGLFRMALYSLCLVSIQGFAGQSLQPGFYYHEPSAITLESASSGLICTDADGKKTLCEPAIKILVTGEDTCNWPVGQQNPCTNFGYEFNYSGAQQGTYLECSRTRYNPRTGEQKDSYSRAIDAESGRIAFQTFRTYAPVDERLIFSEVHDCSYLGERVATIEFMIYYEPEVGSDGSGDNADQHFAEVPNACSSPYLTEDTAAGLLRATGARKHVASEHIPVLQSQCLYGAAGGQQGQVGYVFKFMLSDMFDVDKLATQQLDFNATFANGGTAPDQILENPGARAYVFRKGDRATLFVITGIKGRKDFAGRSTEFVAQYYIDHPEMDYASKQGALLEQARLHMRHWTRE